MGNLALTVPTDAVIVAFPARPAAINPASVTADDAILLTEGFPLPHSLRRVDGRWRVEAGPVIAARKAAEAASKKTQPQ